MSAKRATGRAERDLHAAQSLYVVRVQDHNEDIGEMDAGSLAGLKALYSDARKRASVAAGIGAYLFTALESVVLPIGPGPRPVQAIRRPGKSDLLVLSPKTEEWLRHGYRARMDSDAVRRDLGEILARGEPETGIGERCPRS